MEELITDHIHGILNDVTHDVRSGRRLVALVGILGGTSIPADVSKETMSLSKLITLREMFNALMEPVSSFAKCKEFMPLDRQKVASEINFQNLFEQLDETRKQIAEYDSINYPLIISWVVSQAKSRKLLRNMR